MWPDSGGNAGRVAVGAGDLLEAASRFFPAGHGLLESRVVLQGYSGSAFASVETPAGLWLLRRWPPGFERERLRFVHRALAESRSRGFSGVPALAMTPTGETIVGVDGRLYDAQEFLGGEAPTRQVPRSGRPVPNVACVASPERVAALAEGLARFHESTSGLSPRPGERAVPLLHRITELQGEARRRVEHLRRAVWASEASGERETALRWLALFPGAVEAALGAAERRPPGGSKEVLCHADLWPAHVRFEGDSFAGLVDFESLSFASPALDLAQLVCHFGGWENADLVLRSYGAVAPLGARDEASLVPEAVADLAAEGLWALEEVYGGSSAISIAQRAAHRLNLDRLLGPLEEAARLCEGLVR